MAVYFHSWCNYFIINEYCIFILLYIVNDKYECMFILTPDALSISLFIYLFTYNDNYECLFILHSWCIHYFIFFYLFSQWKKLIVYLHSWCCNYIFFISFLKYNYEWLFIFIHDAWGFFFYFNYDFHYFLPILKLHSINTLFSLLFDFLYTFFVIYVRNILIPYIFRLYVS